MSPLVSIIMPVFNSERFLDESIGSVFSQTYRNWELIIIDDCSHDGSLQKIETLAKKNPTIIVLKNDKNEGAAITRNKGINKASGTYIAFLDADDIWLPDKLEKQLEILQKRQADVCFASYELIDEAGNKLHKIIEAKAILTHRKLLKSNYIGNLTGIYNAHALGKINTINIRRRQDWLLWLEALQKSSKPAIGIKTPLAYYRIRSNSISSNKLKLLKYNYQVYRKGLKYSTIKSLIYFLQFLWEQILVKPKQTKSTV